MDYISLQHYWWFIVSLLGALLVFLMFVQGANSLVFSLGATQEERRVVINSAGRKWEIPLPHWLPLAEPSSPRFHYFTAPASAVLTGCG